MCTALSSGKWACEASSSSRCASASWPGLREELPLAEAVEVKVTKFQPPIGGDCDHIAVVMQG